MVSGELQHHDQAVEQSLRPTMLAQYIGQSKTKENLSILLKRRKCVKNL